MTGRRFDAVVERLRACRVIPVATLDDPAAAGELIKIVAGVGGAIERRQIDP